MTSPTIPVEDAIPFAAVFKVVDIMDVLPTSAFACMIWFNAPVAYAWVIYPPDIFDRAPPMTFAAFPTAFPLAGNTLESALSNIPPTVVEFPLEADVALATEPNAV